MIYASGLSCWGSGEASKRIHSLRDLAIISYAGIYYTHGYAYLLGYDGFNSFGKILRGGIAGPNGISTFSFLGNLYTDFHLIWIAC